MAVPPDSLAERGQRLLAASIDELILLALFLPTIFGAVPALMRLVESGGADAESLDTTTVLQAMVGGPGALVTVVALIAWCVLTVWLVATRGQSIGKRLVGIKVVRTDGSRASFGRIFWLRNVVNTLPSFLPYIGLVYAALIDPIFIFQESRQCLHDKLADTIVIRARGLLELPRA